MRTLGETLGLVLALLPLATFGWCAIDLMKAPSETKALVKIILGGALWTVLAKAVWVPAVVVVILGAVDLIVLRLRQKDDKG